MNIHVYKTTQETALTKLNHCFFHIAHRLKPPLSFHLDFAFTI